MHSPALSGAVKRHSNSTPRAPAAERAAQRAAETARTDTSERRRRHRSWVDEGSPYNGESMALLVDNDSTTDGVALGSSDGVLSSQRLAKFTNALMYGVINSILTIPCMYGYAAIIFGHPDFADFMPALSKLVMFSSVVHQVMFTLLSSLPFAIGQVQDAGLIFLSAIATSICKSLGEDVPLEAKVTTTVVTIGMATASLGVVLVLLGRFKLAGLVSYLPMPVVGGYLAFIGLFCMYAGLSLCTGLVINDFTSMMQIWEDPHYLLLCAPGMLGGIILLLVSQRCENNFSLPATILLMPMLFFAVLALFGVSLQEARDYGWVSPASDPAGFVQMFDLFDFNQMHWNQVPRQFTTWLGMTFVVAFSSCLDVAAIEMDMGSQLDINHELKSVGWSNFVSGMVGGYTGSYIFSQTIFTYRSKTNSRVVGVCVIISEFAIVLVPLSVMSLVPRFFFAATLIFIAIDLMLEWLVHVYHKVLPREYVVLWLSFIAINMVSLELGMVLGVGFAIINFLLGYAQVRVVNRRSRSSAAVRKLAARTLLGQKRDSIVYLELYGYLFFGSSVQILQDVKKAVHIRKSHASMKQKSSKGLDEPHYVDDSGIPLTPVAKRDVPIECLDGSPAQHPDGLPTEYVVMDFSRVSGMDATAARSAFMILQQHCKRHEITVIFADVLPEIRSLLLNNEIAEEENFFVNAESALEFCENQLLVHANQLQDINHHHESMSVLLHRFMGEPDDSQLFRGVDQFFRKYEVPVGYEFYRVASYPDRFYFLASGRVALFMNDDGSVALGKTLTLLENVLPGAMFGEVDFFGRQYRYMAARALEPCTVFEMTRQTYESMDELVPDLWNRLRDVVMQSMALSITNTTSINSLNNASSNLPGVN